MGRRNDTLFEPTGREILELEYVKRKLSIYAIAKSLNTYPTRIWRALEHHGITRRSSGEAQTEAIKAGRHPHPTAGKNRTDKQKKQISESLKKSLQQGKTNK